MLARFGIAGVLTQREPGGKETVIGYAIVASVKRFRPYLYEKSFTLFTDCASVRGAFEKRDLNPSIGRWVLEWQDYQFDLRHRPGFKCVTLMP